ncbi:MAG: hypothetical protein KDC12_13000 [Flavobacteriales bacterium]|nr:hypothetical protein [Flavobacteriales bacterium]
MNSLQTENALATVQDRILEIDYPLGNDATIEETKRIFDWAIGLIPDGKHFCIVKANFSLNVDPEVREWLSSEERLNFILADAFVVNSMALRIVANFYLKYNRPKHPTRTFNSFEEARKWIAGLADNLTVA